MQQTMNRKSEDTMISMEEYLRKRNVIKGREPEEQAAAGLMHPNIVNVYDVGEEGGIYYIVMELVDCIKNNKTVVLKNITKGEEYELDSSHLSSRQREMLLCGGLLDYTREMNK